jgi:GMP synthase (glutamine-hydrolysing)
VNYLLQHSIAYASNMASICAQIIDVALRSFRLTHAMSKIVALLHDTADAPNHCTAWLADHGHEVVTACPAAGDAIPGLGADVAGAVVFGGRFDVKMKEDLAFLRAELAFIEAVLKRGLPYLGLCLGGQLLAHVLGEEVDLHPQGFAEYGYYDLLATPEGADFVGPRPLKVLQSHWHGWYETPRGATRLAYTEAFPQQAFRYGENAYGLQFHPEATRATLERWISRRPPERYLLKGTQPPERQLADHAAHDAALQSWFNGFLNGWIGPATRLAEAAS